MAACLVGDPHQEGVAVEGGDSVADGGNASRATHGLRVAVQVERRHLAGAGGTLAHDQERKAGEHHAQPEGHCRRARIRAHRGQISATGFGSTPAVVVCHA